MSVETVITTDNGETRLKNSEHGQTKMIVNDRDVELKKTLNLSKFNFLMCGCFNLHKTYSILEYFENFKKQM